MPTIKNARREVDTSASIAKEASKRNIKRQIRKGKRDGQTLNEISISDEEDNKPDLDNYILITRFFFETFRHLFTPKLAEIIQNVKAHLYEREYALAFGSQEYLEAYVCRWSVSRAMAYTDMIKYSWFGNEVTSILKYGKTSDASLSENTTLACRMPLNVCCIGGGAGAEAVAFAAMIHDSQVTDDNTSKEEDDNEHEKNTGDTHNDLTTSNLTKALPEGSVSDRQALSLKCTFLDFASWSDTLKTISSSLTSRDAKHQLYVPADLFDSSFLLQDVLAPLNEQSTEALRLADIVTLFFTAGEMYTQSTTATTKFLLTLHTIVKEGAYLVVVDSAGGFEDVSLGARKDNEDTTTTGYKLGFLLDKTMESRGHWKKVVSDDAKWWRVPQALKNMGEEAYPLPLESMRCLIRVYKRLGHAK